MNEVHKCLPHKEIQIRLSHRTSKRYLYTAKAMKGESVVKINEMFADL